MLNMSLDSDDLQNIRAIMREELKPLEGRVGALENDVKDIYFMISGMAQDINGLQRDMRTVKKLVKI